MRHHHLFTTAAAAAFVAGAAIAQSNAGASQRSHRQLGCSRHARLADQGRAVPCPGAPRCRRLFARRDRRRAGSSQTEAIRGFQQANGLQRQREAGCGDQSGADEEQSPVHRDGEAQPPRTSAGRSLYPIPSKPEDQAKLDFLGYRNMLEKVAERYHTTPETIVALNGPDKLIGVGQTLRLPNVVPPSRDYAGANEKQAQLLTALNVEAKQPQGDYVVVDKSEGTLKVYQGEFPSGSAKPIGKLLAQFPVTTGSQHDPLPLGQLEGHDLFLPSAVPLSARPVLGRVRREGGAQASAGTERPGRRRLARPDQGALRHPRDARAAD